MPTMHAKQSMRFASNAGTRFSRSAVKISTNRTQRLAVVAKAGPVFVAGAEGQTASRIVKKLLDSGFSVSAGVDDADRGAAIVDFFKKYEIISRAAKVSLVEMDEENTLSKALKRATVVVVDGDNLGKRRVDQRYVSNLLEAAQEADASDFVLVTPLSGGGGGGFFAQFFGGGGGRSGYNKLESNVIDSGLDYAIIRTANPNVPDSFGSMSNVVVGSLGTVKGGQTSKTQVADVVSTVLSAGYKDVVLEVKGDPEAPAVPIDDQIEEALTEFEEEEEEEE